MLDDRTFDSLMMIGASVSAIHFHKVPDYRVLQALTENAENIQFYLPNDEVIPFLGNGSFDQFASNIITANFETDCFIDHNAIYNYPNLTHLTLTCSCSTADRLEENDLANMQLAISELDNLTHLTFDVNRMKDYPQQQIKDLIHFPFKKIEMNFLEKKRRKPKIKKNLLTK